MGWVVEKTDENSLAAVKAAPHEAEPGGCYFLRNLEKMLPLAGAVTGVGPAGLGSPAGERPGALPRAGRGSADFWALAGTARGVRGVEMPGGRGTPRADQRVWAQRRAFRPVRDSAGEQPQERRLGR